MITKKDYKFQKLGHKLVKLSTHGKYKMIAILVRGGNIISIGINKNGSPPPYLRKHRSNLALHAEMDALMGISKDQSKNSTLYVIGETCRGNSILTKPCQTCYNFSEAMLVRRIVYETREGSLEEI